MNMAEVQYFQPAIPAAPGTSIAKDLFYDDLLMFLAADSAVHTQAARSKQVENSIWDLLCDYSENGWDGYSAVAISPVTAVKAIAFLNSLPFSLRLPEIYPEPTGEVAFEWSKSVNSIVVVSISESGRLVFASKFGEAKLNGIEFFAGAIPEPILSAIQRAIK